MRGRWTAEPAVRAGLVFVALALAGVAGLGLGWFGASGTFDLSNQLAFAVSGGAGGLGLVVAGCGLLMAHVDRCLAAADLTHLDRLLVTAYGLGRTDRRPPAPNGSRPDANRSRSRRSGIA
ncbi:MAG TPA: hypothetical protein VE990_01165 [Acidimicrobiales bacterium]|nr:hypothetical protein [Acidimicrobiales bacterium]